MINIFSSDCRFSCRNSPVFPNEGKLIGGLSIRLATLIGTVLLFEDECEFSKFPKETTTEPALVLVSYRVEGVPLKLNNKKCVIRKILILLNKKNEYFLDLIKQWISMNLVFQDCGKSGI